MVIAHKATCPDVTFRTFGLQIPTRMPPKTSIAPMCYQSGHKCAQSHPKENPIGAQRPPLDFQISKKMHPRDTECAGGTPEGSRGCLPKPKIHKKYPKFTNLQEFDEKSACIVVTSM